MSKISLTSLTQGRYSNLPEETIFTSDALFRVEELSATLDPEEIFDFLCINGKHLSDVDMEVFLIAHRRGKAIAKAKYGDKLLSSASDRNGGQISLAYLRHFGNRWAGIDSPSSGGGEDAGWSLRIVPPGVARDDKGSEG